MTKVSSLTIGGSFKGELIASNELIILATGSCAGKVVCQDLIVENGGCLMRTYRVRHPVKWNLSRRKNLFFQGDQIRKKKNR